MESEKIDIKELIGRTKILCDELENLNHSEGDVFQKINEGAKKIRVVLSSFRKEIALKGFRNSEDEIHFFKYIKPRVQSYLIFFSVLSEIETEKLMQDSNGVQSCKDKKLRMFQYIMQENKEFVAYYKAGLTHLDAIYFLRAKNLSCLLKHSSRQLDDPDFNTSHDTVAANLMAFDLYKEHVLSDNLVAETKSRYKSKLKWTATKLDLVELIYALHSSGALNYGDAELKDICQVLENAFQTKVGDLYRSFHDVVNRKKQQSKFIPKLEQSLLKKLDDLDSYPTN